MILRIVIMILMTSNKMRGDKKNFLENHHLAPVRKVSNVYGGLKEISLDIIGMEDLSDTSLPSDQIQGYISSLSFSLLLTLSNTKTVLKDLKEHIYDIKIEKEDKDITCKISNLMELFNDIEIEIQEAIDLRARDKRADNEFESAAADATRIMAEYKSSNIGEVNRIFNKVLDILNTCKGFYVFHFITTLRSICRDAVNVNIENIIENNVMNYENARLAFNEISSICLDIPELGPTRGGTKRRTDFECEESKKHKTNTDPPTGNDSVNNLEDDLENSTENPDFDMTDNDMTDNEMSDNDLTDNDLTSSDRIPIIPDHDLINDLEGDGLQSSFESDNDDILHTEYRKTITKDVTTTYLEIVTEPTKLVIVYTDSTTITITPTVTDSNIFTSTPTVMAETVVITPTITDSNTYTHTPTEEAEVTYTRTPTVIGTIRITLTPTITHSSTYTYTPTEEAGVTYTSTPTVIGTESVTITPTITGTLTFTETPTLVADPVYSTPTIFGDTHYTRETHYFDPTTTQKTINLTPVTSQETINLPATTTQETIYGDAIYTRKTIRLDPTYTQEVIDLKPITTQSTITLDDTTTQMTRTSTITSTTYLTTSTITKTSSVIAFQSITIRPDLNIINNQILPTDVMQLKFDSVRKIDFKELLRKMFNEYSEGKIPQSRIAQWAKRIDKTANDIINQLKLFVAQNDGVLVYNPFISCPQIKEKDILVKYNKNLFKSTKTFNDLIQYQSPPFCKAYCLRLDIPNYVGDFFPPNNLEIAFGYNRIKDHIVVKDNKDTVLDPCISDKINNEDCFYDRVPRKGTTLLYESLKLSCPPESICSYLSDNDDFIGSQMISELDFMNFYLSNFVKVLDRIESVASDQNSSQYIITGSFFAGNLMIFVMIMLFRYGYKRLTAKKHAKRVKKIRFQQDEVELKPLNCNVEAATSRRERTNDIFKNLQEISNAPV